jgi:alpha-tubulin suppressor-like RCC1 family protein
VSGLSDAAVAISAGRYFTCAALRNGRVECWGANFLGQLGNDAGPYSAVAVEVEKLDGLAVAVAAGGRHTCALMAAGHVACWGANGYGQLGDPGFGTSSSPLAVGGLGTSTLAIAAGTYHTCALGASGEVACWGSNFFGQLGNGGVFESTVPVAVTGVSASATSVVSGDGHTCALIASISVDCWGWNRYGQLGDGSRVDRPRAVRVGDLRDPRAISAGGSHACAVVLPDAAQHAVTCWGSNRYGQLGDGSSVDSSAPVPVVGAATGTVAVSAGARHTCALAGSGLVECWGANGDGQVGNGVDGGRSDVSPVPGLPDAVAVDAGELHTCALRRTAAVVCWGSNDSGQLGDGTTVDRPLPVDVGGLPGEVAAVAAGGRHTCALTSAGGVLCWGANGSGQLGDGTVVASLEPVAAVMLADAVAIGAGSRHTCAVRRTGDLVCWGANDWGQLGDGTRIGRSVPTRVANLSERAATLGLGAEHTCATLASGAVECWGFNYFGQLGDGRAPLSGSPTPVPVVGYGGAP